MIKKRSNYTFLRKTVCECKGLFFHSFSAYSKVQDARALATVLGEADLSETDKKYMKFGEEFENKFLNQGMYENRTIDETLDLMRELLKIIE